MSSVWTVFAWQTGHALHGSQLTLKQSCEQKTLPSLGSPWLRHLGHCSFAGLSHLAALDVRQSVEQVTVMVTVLLMHVCIGI